MDSKGVFLQAVLNGIPSIGNGFGQVKKPKTCHLFITIYKLCCYWSGYQVVVNLQYFSQSVLKV